ncbi:hypothetical protein TrRE_jg5218, partial [Triparma retinervis]
MSFLGIKKKRSKKGDGDSVSTKGGKGSDESTVTSGLTEGTSKGRTVITCAILLMEAPSSASTSSTPAGRKKFEVLQVSFTQDATIRSVLQNVKLQSSHNKDSLAAACVGLCRPEGGEFLKALLQSMEIQKTIESPADDGAKSPDIVAPLSPSYVVYAGPKKSETESKYVRTSVFVPQTSPDDDLPPTIDSTGSTLEVLDDTRYDAPPSSPVGSLSDFFSKGLSSPQPGVGSPMSRVAILATAFLLATSLLTLLLNNRMEVSDLDHATLTPGSTLTHISF